MEISVKLINYLSRNKKVNQYKFYDFLVAYSILKKKDDGTFSSTELRKDKSKFGFEFIINLNEPSKTVVIVINYSSRMSSRYKYSFIDETIITKSEIDKIIAEQNEPSKQNSNKRTENIPSNSKITEINNKPTRTDFPLPNNSQHQINSEKETDSISSLQSGGTNSNPESVVEIPKASSEETNLSSEKETDSINSLQSGGTNSNPESVVEIPKASSEETNLSSVPLKKIKKVNQNKDSSEPLTNNILDDKKPAKRIAFFEKHMVLFVVGILLVVFIVGGGLVFLCFKHIKKLTEKKSVYYLDSNKTFRKVE